MSILNFEDVLGNEPILEIDVNNRRDIFAHYLNGTEVFCLMSDGFMRTTSGWKYRNAAFCLGDIAADSDAYTFPLFRAPVDITLEAIHIGVDTTVGADATNYNTIYVENSGHSTDISTLTTAVGFTLRVPRSFASLNSSAKIIKAGSTLQLRFAKTATGKALSGVVVSFVYSVNQAYSTVGNADDNIFRVSHDVAVTPVICVDHTYRDSLVLRENGVVKARCNIDGVFLTEAPDSYYFHVVNSGTIVDADGAAKKSAIFKPHANVKIEKVYYGVISTLAADSGSAFTEILVKDASGNILAHQFANGPYGIGNSLTKGIMYDMGAINEEYAVLTSSEQLQLEYVCPGASPDVPGLITVVVYRKLA